LSKLFNLEKLLIVFLLSTALIFPVACAPSSPPASPDEEMPVMDKEPVITIYRTATGNTDSLNLEEYVKGVVAAEIGGKFPLEALKAQAVAARTMSLVKIEYENGTHNEYKADASDDHKNFQAYDESKITVEIARAVDETRGQALVYKGRYAYTLFHSYSKSKTASIEESFPGLAAKAENIKEYIVPVKACGFDKAPDKYKNWQVQIAKSEFLNILGSPGGDLSGLTIKKRGPSGRALDITTGNASISGAELRQKIGPDILYSTDITNISLQNDSVVIDGNGWGHGCGLEQYGASVLAEQGQTARDILTHYYPNTKVHQVYK
jgi:stage II sporulation protein D